ncbi:hypothetical protein V8J88_15680 [Massilia sp. W12]|uniref:hypothetical protein n=1 Tax=Massilia sp. W12 TaxID=3126507 RepID=UPI0030D25674
MSAADMRPGQGRQGTLQMAERREAACTLWISIDEGWRKVARSAVHCGPCRKKQEIPKKPAFKLVHEKLREVCNARSFSTYCELNNFSSCTA